MKLIDRPIYNIKQIDFMGIGFVCLGIAAITIFVFSFQQVMTIGEFLNFMFSFGLLEKRNVIVDSFGSPSVQTGMFNTLATSMNITKIVFWILAPILLLLFLFKKPSEVIGKEKF